MNSTCQGKLYSFTCLVNDAVSQCSTLDVIKEPYIFQHFACTLPVRLQQPVSLRILQPDHS